MQLVRDVFRFCFMPAACLCGCGFPEEVAITDGVLAYHRRKPISSYKSSWSLAWRRLSIIPAIGRSQLCFPFSYFTGWRYGLSGVQTKFTYYNKVLKILGSRRNKQGAFLIICGTPYMGYARFHVIGRHASHRASWGIPISRLHRFMWRYWNDKQNWANKNYWMKYWKSIPLYKRPPLYKSENSQK